jgi:hypothetical protein
MKQEVTFHFIQHSAFRIQNSALILGLVAQQVERRFEEPLAQVRFLSGPFEAPVF